MLKVKNQFQRLDTHEKAFNAVKKALVSPPVLAPFDPKRETRLETDASRLNGLGFALLQKHGDVWKLVLAGSRFLSDPESSYAMIELEAIAIKYGIDKCHLYLAGMPHFTVICDHRPLIPIMNNYSLLQVENAKLQKIKATLQSHYVFTVEWRKGKDHSIADCLSRAPVDDPDENDEFAEINSITLATICATVTEHDDKNEIPDPIIEKIRQVALNDPDYQALVKAIEDDFVNIEQARPFVRQFKAIRNELAIEGGLVLYGPRLVVPKSERKDVLEKLHASHQGMSKTKSRARSALYWPGINHEIEEMVSKCERCQERLPSHPKETIRPDPMPKRPFESVSADLFTLGGKHFLVYVDRMSGYPKIAQWRDDPSSSQVAYEIRQFFVDLGVPKRFRSDGGMQFAAASFRKFLERWGVEWVPSTPHFPSGNGHAECNVKLLKNLLAKMQTPEIRNEEFQEALLELRNTPRNDGLSPNAIIFGNNLRSRVPAHHTSFDSKWQTAAEELDKKFAIHRKKIHDHYNSTARDLKPLRVGDKVRVQDHATKRWDKIGDIIGVGEN
mgnify:CR=1 FL=1